jgi:putative transposase
VGVPIGEHRDRSIEPDNGWCRRSTKPKSTYREAVPALAAKPAGKVFVGSTFLAACERLQISVIKAAPRTPTDKPHIERVFAAINSGFTQYLAGYVGPNVVRRGLDPAAEAQWTLAEVQNLLDLWIVAVWQNRTHSGLRHPAMPRKDLTPNEAYAALSGIAPGVNVALTTDDHIGLLPVDWRSIQPYGINFAGLHYDSPELHEYRGISSGLPEPARGRWEIRYDPYRMNSIFVRDHKRGRWIHADWMLAKQALAPFSLDVLTAARKAINNRGQIGSGVDVLAEINRIQSGVNVSARERSAARRNATATPVVPTSQPHAVNEMTLEDRIEQKSIGGILDGVDRRDKVAALRGLVQSQNPYFDPANEDLPAFADRWFERYERGDDITHWYGSQLAS